MDRSFGYDQAAFPPYDAAPRPPAVQGEVSRPDTPDLPAVPGKQLLLGLQRHTHTHTPSGKSGPKDQAAPHYYYTAPSRVIEIVNFTISLALSAGTLMASAGTPYRLVPAHFYPCTHPHLFNGSLSGTTRVSRYQKGKTNLDFTEARDIEWQWHQLVCMQICTSLRTEKSRLVYLSGPGLPRLSWKRGRYTGF